MQMNLLVNQALATITTLDNKSGTHIHAVFLDWSKAFDKVPHERLLSKLKHYGIKAHLLGWFKNYLTGRTQRVVFGGTQYGSPYGYALRVNSGQRAGPRFIQYLCCQIAELHKNSNFKQYADDCSLSKEIKSEKYIKEMQEDLNSAGAWCGNNSMELNALKCKVMEITRAHKINKNEEYLQATYEIGGIILGQVETERLLGIHISKDLITTLIVR
jgi:ribonucleases P/MRP protein subunit RPP40